MSHLIAYRSSLALGSGCSLSTWAAFVARNPLGTHVAFVAGLAHIALQTSWTCDQVMSRRISGG